MSRSGASKGTFSAGSSLTSARVFSRSESCRSAGKSAPPNHHFTQAGMTEAVIEWWGTAGQRSLARSALVEGAEQLKRALDQIAFANAPLQPSRSCSRMVLIVGEPGIGQVAAH